MGIARTLAALVGRHAKSALILLYALHVTFLFREHLFQLYHAALDTVHHATAETHVGSVLEKAKRIFDRRDDGTRIAAAHGIPIAILSLADDHARHEDHHDPGDEKRRDRQASRRWIRRRVTDLYRQILRFRPPEGTEIDHSPFTLLRMMRFSA